MAFDTAVITCAVMSGHVAVPTSLSEHQFIWDMVSEVAEGPVWVGCTDREEEGKWVQVDEVECSFFNWGPGEPNNAGGENCVLMNPPFDGSWNDGPCTWPTYVVCQRPAVAPTIPPVGLHCLQADTNGRFASHCLTGHVIKELPIKGVVGCGSACRDEPRCRSFNVRLRRRSNEKICQLNNVTREEADNEDIDMDNACYYFNI
ncbi:mannose-binding protein C-like [Asterias rubens]|uniref:mannose-binding protein C-like n=1 Tax=Asterias rubens TaxID=7604 RepID=UPI0014556FDE|nr:mannose-binding protein C-like [Asterias rubens]